MSELRVVVHREIPEDEEFRQQWDELVERMEQPEVFYTWEWAAAVARAYRGPEQPLLFVAYREQTLAGIAALVMDGKGEVSFLAKSTADYCDFVSAPGDREEWIRLVMWELQGMGIAELRLASVPADSVSAAVLRTGVRDLGYAIFTRPAYFCARVPLNSSEDRALASKTIGHKLKRMAKAAGELRAATVEHGSRWEDFEAEFAEFSVSHVGRFLTAGEISNLVRPERRAFLIELARLLGERGWLRFSTLRIDGRSMAWNYGFKFAGKWFYYQPAFDVKARRLSVGSYLLCKILQNATADPEVHIVDLGLGDEEYKQNYAKGGRQTVHVTGSRSKARLMRHICRYRAASLVKRSPRIEKVVREVVSGVAGSRAKGIVGWLRRSGLRAGGGLPGAAQVSFMEWAGPGPVPAGDYEVQPLSPKLLAMVAMRHEGEDETHQYLLRAARRMQSGHWKGFALLAGDRVPVHFCGVAPFERYQQPKVRHAKGVVEEAMLVCNEWTAGPQRGRGLEALCASRVATILQESGKSVWVSSEGGNGARELEQAGFVRRFSVVREKGLFFTRTRRVEIADPKTGVMNLYPAA